MARKFVVVGNEKTRGEDIVDEIKREADANRLEAEVNFVWENVSTVARDSLLALLSQPEWMQVDGIALDVHYPDNDFGGIVNVFDALAEKMQNEIASGARQRPAWQRLCFYSVLMTQNTPERDEIEQMVKERDERLRVFGSYEPRYYRAIAKYLVVP